MAKTDLAALLDQLDEETRLRWEAYLETVDAEVSEKGPQAVRQHLDAALEHILAVGWAMRRCYATEETQATLQALGEAAQAVEAVRACLDALGKKPEWSQ